MECRGTQSLRTTSCGCIAVRDCPQAQHYAALRKPYLINDIHEQNVLLDRRYVYQRLSVRFSASGTLAP